MTYRISRGASQDLIAIYASSARDFGEAQARQYFFGLESTFKFLADHPRAARERHEIQPPVRAFRYKSHLVIYEIDGNDVVILRIRHGHEDWMHPAG
ncbi:MAG: type II toxin-antitoxin system RelE/ParE family toxin [Sphingomonadales bacterium]|nr:MAG: type II toxin-antitoxin system RelE/ParE family toxin [Sphingomonadales bacterium]